MSLRFYLIRLECLVLFFDCIILWLSIKFSISLMGSILLVEGWSYSFPRAMNMSMRKDLRALKIDLIPTSQWGIQISPASSFLRLDPFFFEIASAILFFSLIYIPFYITAEFLVKCKDIKTTKWMLDRLNRLLSDSDHSLLTLHKHGNWLRKEEPNWFLKVDKFINFWLKLDLMVSLIKDIPERV